MQINQHPETLAELEKFLEWAKLANPPVNIFPLLQVMCKQFHTMGAKMVRLETELETLSNEYHGYDP
jgi:hypothetical protein